jgi:uroporphyrinogen decarboxylase
VETSELACEITIQPIDIIGTDAAILFSDILVVPKAMGMQVELIEHKGPLLPNPIKTQQDIEKLLTNDAIDQLQYVYDVIQLTKKELNGRVPLIGFAGAPFTLLCYMIEGKGSKAFDLAKQFCISQPELAHRLLDKITQVTIGYLRKQVESGVDCVQIFDSWSGLLSPVDFKIFAEPYLLRISDALSKVTQVILFPKGSWYALEDLSKSSASALGVDWNITPEMARQLTQNRITLQGNFDPNHLIQSPEQIQKEVHEMINRFGKDQYIVNLGHGILPNIPVEGAKAFVESVKSYKVG